MRGIGLDGADLARRRRDPFNWHLPRRGPVNRRATRKLVMHALRRARAWVELDGIIAIDSARQWMRLAKEIAHVLRYSR